MLTTTSSFDAIEERARELQIDLWDRQFKYWPGEKVTPLDVCDPRIAARHLGYGVQEGWLSSPETPFGYQLGGFLDRPAKLIAIADCLPPRTKLFTLAHEVGHLVWHPGLHHHREVPIHGLTEPREPTDRREREANHFAGCFLVPRKQLRLAFEASFRTETLRLTDDVAWELLGEEYMTLLNSPPSSLHFERVVAQALHFGRLRFTNSLHDLFQVSPTTLAIRLRQCGITRR